jgi:hypothetical protein
MNISFGLRDIGPACHIAISVRALPIGTANHGVYNITFSVL